MYYIVYFVKEEEVRALLFDATKELLAKDKFLDDAFTRKKQGREFAFFSLIIQELHSMKTYFSDIFYIVSNDGRYLYQIFHGLRNVFHKILVCRRDGPNVKPIIVNLRCSDDLGKIKEKGRCN